MSHIGDLRTMLGQKPKTSTFNIFIALNTTNDLYLVAETRAYLRKMGVDNYNIDYAIYNMEKYLEPRNVYNLLQFIANDRTGRDLLYHVNHPPNKLPHRKALLSNLDQIGYYDLYCFSVYDSYFHDQVMMALKIRQRHPNARILFGGVEIQLRPQTREIIELLNMEWAMGDIEATLYSIIKGEDYSKVYTPLKKLTKEDVPIFKPSEIEFSRGDIIVNGSRGCANRCKYCNSPAMCPYNEVNREVLAEWILALERQGTRYIYLNDGNFNRRSKHFHRFLDRLGEAGTNVIMEAMLELGTLDLEAIPKLRKAGLSIISLGLECINPELGKLIGKRMPSYDEVYEMVRLARQHSVKVLFFYIAGIPGQTDEIFKEETDFMLRLQRDFNVTFECYDYFVSPNSYIDRHREDFGIVWDNYKNRQKEVLPEFTPVIESMPMTMQTPIGYETMSRRMRYLDEQVGRRIQHAYKE